MADYSASVAAVLAAMRRSYDHESTRCRIAADMLRVLADQSGSAKHWHADQLRGMADKLEGMR